MPLAFKLTKRIHLPNEEGWIDIRMPSLAILDAARAAASQKAFATMSGIDPSVLAGLRSVSDETIAKEQAYDWQTLLRACILAWSYEEPITPENIAELTEDVVTLLLAELFPVESKEDRKKGSVVSTNTSKEKVSLRLPG